MTLAYQVVHRHVLMLLFAVTTMLGLNAWAAAEEQSAAANSKQFLQLAQSARQLAASSHYEQAIAKAEKALKGLSKELGDAHPYVAYIADDIARWYFTLGQLDQSADYAKRATRIIQQNQGKDSKVYAQLLSTLAAINLAQGEITTAANHYQSVLDIYQSVLDANDPTLAQAYRNVAVVLLEQGRFPGAVQSLEKAIAITSPDKQFNTPAEQELALTLTKAYRQNNQGDAAQTLLTNLATAINSKNTKDSLWLRLQIEQASLSIYYNQLKQAEALLVDASKSIDKQNIAPLDLATLQYKLGYVYILKGQLVEAEAVYKKALLNYRQSVSQYHPSIARTLHSLAIVYSNLGMTDLATEYYQQAITTFSKALGDDNPAEASTRLEYSLLLTKTGNIEEAITTANTSLSTFQRLDESWQLQLGYANSALATALAANQQTAEAIAAFEKAKSLMRAARGDDAIDLPPALTQLAELYLESDKPKQAQENIDTALAIYRAQQANTPFALANSLMVKARLQQHRQDTEAAQQTADESIAIMRQRLRQLSGRLRDNAREEQRQSRHLFEQYLSIVYPRYQAGHGDLAEGLFQAAQYPIDSGTSAAISRMANRFSSKDTALATLIKQREDLLDKITLLDQQQTNQLAGIKANKSSPKIRDDHSLKRLQTKLSSIDKRLEKNYPDYLQLTSPLPASIQSVQKILQPKEAAFLQLSTDQGSYLFLLTQDSLHITKSELTHKQLTDYVNAIRDSVDLSKVMSIALMPEFKFREAHAIYQGLFAPFKETLQSTNHLIVVFDGGMQNLNPALLLTRLPDKSRLTIKDYQQLDYLVNDMAISVAPSLSSLVYLRQLPVKNKQQKKLLGFGDPDLDTRTLPTQGNTTRDLSSIIEIKPEDLRSALSSLPDTRTELETIATVVGKPNSQLYFREQATEAQIKQLNLSPYNILIFATHGLLSGEFMGLNEPSLVMTPPDAASQLDNGLLTSSEITELQLNADWVILSACNTAGPSGRPGAEGLSGLAKAFFYAGSKSLLVSHWAVGSEAATYLTTGMFRHTKQSAERSTEMGMAEALRRTELELIQGQHSEIYAHPAFWAPFTVVGEGNH